MPEPLLYVKSFAIAMITSALFGLVIIHRRRAAKTDVNGISALAIGVGIAIGLIVAKLPWTWPPASALDRLVTIVLPGTICIQWIAAADRTPLWLAWTLRVCLVASLPRILIHQSVYLDEANAWTLSQTYLAMLLGSLLLGIVWISLCRLSHRSQESASIPVALCLSLQSAGISVMLAGYIKGGVVAIPITAAILGFAIVAGSMRKRCEAYFTKHCEALIGIAVVCLFSVLFIGHFFGRLTMTSALTMMMAPTLCWVTETRGLPRWRPSRVAAIRISVVAIPLIITLVAAKRDFDRKLAPLMSDRSHHSGLLATRTEGHQENADSLPQW